MVSLQCLLNPTTNTTKPIEQLEKNIQSVLTQNLKKMTMVIPGIRARLRLQSQFNGKKNFAEEIAGPNGANPERAMNLLAKNVDQRHKSKK
jgi:hypothetical protein